MSAGKSAGVNLLPFKIYGVIYVLLMACYITGVIGRDVTVPVTDWVSQAFPKGGESLVQLQKDADVQKAQFRADKDYSFDTLNDIPVAISAGQKVTLPIAAEIALAVQKDIKDNKTLKEMSFPYKELQIYKNGWFWNINWAYTFTVYNILGLFVGLYFGLKAPVGKMLGDSAHETSEALAAARAARREAGELKEKYDQLLQELAAEKERLSKVLIQEEESEKVKQHQNAEYEAQEILKSVKGSINADIEMAARKLKQEIAAHAVQEARVMLAKELDERMHDSVVDDFIADLEK